LTDALLTGKWELISYRLMNDSHAWTYGGHNVAQNRPNYEYDSINTSLGHLNCNFFHLLAFVNPQQRPTGSIDFDELTVAYRNYSLVSPGNGGQLRSAPSGGTNDASKLTDGWRHGKDRSWASDSNPNAPLEFTYEFAAPVTIKALQLHQHAEWPAKDVEVLTAEDGGKFSSLAVATMPEKSAGGPNFAFLLARELNRRASVVKIRILSGYRTLRWGLGEIELFGEGGVHSTDDDWYHVNLDLDDLQAGTTYHYRLVAENTAGRVVGSDMDFTVPADARPHAVTGSAIRIRDDSATLSGRVTPMGKKTDFYFEYGLDTNYGSKSAVQYGGLQITPRHAACVISGLKPNTLYHYRLVAVNEVGTTFGADTTFQSK